MTLTLLTNVIVLQIILAQVLILAHAELKRLRHLLFVVELVVCDQDLLKTLGDGYAAEKRDHALVHKQVTRQVHFLQRGPRVDHNLEQSLSALRVDAAVGE